MTAPATLADLTLNEIVAANPDSLPVLSRFGLDTCCGGALTLRDAAERHELVLPDVEEALRQVVTPA